MLNLETIKQYFSSCKVSFENCRKSYQSNFLKNRIFFRKIFGIITGLIWYIRMRYKS